MATTDQDVPDAVDAIRAFNRFYTSNAGLLGERHLDSHLSLTAVRALYEVVHGDDASPGGLARALAVDRGYVTRLVASLRAAGLVTGASAPHDARRTLLAPTAKGRRTLAKLEAATNDAWGDRLATLADDDRARLVGAMRTIETILDPRDAAPSASWLLRDPRPGDLGWVVHRQAALYAAEYGWDWTYEGLIAEICGRFVRDFDPAGERCWLAERDGVVVGSVFVVRKSRTVAQLRLLYVEPSARGLGIGARLVDECVAFARERRYRTLTLWTNDVLVSARRIYEAAGFVLVDEDRHRSFGHDLVGQNWSLRF